MELQETPNIIQVIAVAFDCLLENRGKTQFFEASGTQTQTDSDDSDLEVPPRGLAFTLAEGTIDSAKGGTQPEAVLSSVTYEQ